MVLVAEALQVPLLSTCHSKIPVATKLPSRKKNITFKPL